MQAFLPVSTLGTPVYMCQMVILVHKCQSSIHQMVQVVRRLQCAGTTNRHRDSSPLTSQPNLQSCLATSWILVSYSNVSTRVLSEQFLHRSAWMPDHMLVWFSGISSINWHHWSWRPTLRFFSEMLEQEWAKKNFSSLLFQSQGSVCLALLLSQHGLCAVLSGVSCQFDYGLVH